MSNLGNRETMAENILYYMEANNKTRNDICRDLGIAYTTFSDWVRGRKYPRIDKIEMMANYFGISKADLVERRASGSDRESVDEFRERMHNEYGVVFDILEKATPEERDRAEAVLRAMFESKE